MLPVNKGDTFRFVFDDSEWVVMEYSPEDGGEISARYLANSINETPYNPNMDYTFYDVDERLDLILIFQREPPVDRSNDLEEEWV